MLHSLLSNCIITDSCTKRSLIALWEFGWEAGSSLIVTGILVCSSCFWCKILRSRWWCGLVAVDVKAMRYSWWIRKRGRYCLVEVWVLRSRWWCNLGNWCCWSNRGCWEWTSWGNWEVGRNWSLWLVVSWELWDHINRVLCHFNAANFEGLV